MRQKTAPSTFMKGLDVSSAAPSSPEESITMDRLMTCKVKRLSFACGYSHCCWRAAARSANLVQLRQRPTRTLRDFSDHSSKPRATGAGQRLALFMTQPGQRDNRNAPHFSIYCPAGRRGCRDASLHFRIRNCRAASDWRRREASPTPGQSPAADACYPGLIISADPRCWGFSLGGV